MRARVCVRVRAGDRRCAHTRAPARACARVCTRTRVRTHMRARTHVCVCSCVRVNCRRCHCACRAHCNRFRCTVLGGGCLPVRSHQSVTDNPGDGTDSQKLPERHDAGNDNERTPLEQCHTTVVVRRAVLRCPALRCAALRCAALRCRQSINLVCACTNPGTQALRTAAMTHLPLPGPRG